jgi:hypothetical protein
MQGDTLIAETPRTLLDTTTKTLSKSARVLIESRKVVADLQQSALC